MSVGGGQKGLHLFTLKDLHRRPGWSPYTGLQDPVVTGAARNRSDATTTATLYVTLQQQFLKLRPIKDEPLHSNTVI